MDVVQPTRNQRGALRADHDVIAVQLGLVGRLARPGQPGFELDDDGSPQN